MNANDELGEIKAPGEVRLVRTLPGPIERVWAYLTDADKRRLWFAGGPMEQRQGGKVTLKFRHADIAPNETPPDEHKETHESGMTMDGVVTRWDPPRVLAYTFGDTGESEVTFELTPQGKQVVLILTHRAHGGDLPYMKGFCAGWHSHLSLLIADLQGAPRPPFWPRMLELKEIYAKRLPPVST